MNWKKETLRDLEALGSYLFLIIVASRSLVGEHWGFLGRITSAIAISLILWAAINYFTKIKSSSHTSNLMILLLFTTTFYQTLTFTIFTIIIAGLVLYAHAILRKHKTKSLITGTIIGLISSGLAYLLI